MLEVSSSGLRKVTYAFTNATELNFGRQTGSHEADAELLIIEGECMVFIKICRSKAIRKDQHDKAAVTKSTCLIPDG